MKPEKGKQFKEPTIKDYAPKKEKLVLDEHTEYCRIYKDWPDLIWGAPGSPRLKRESNDAKIPLKHRKGITETIVVLKNGTAYQRWTRMQTGYSVAECNPYNKGTSWSPTTRNAPRPERIREWLAEREANGWKLVPPTALKQYRESTEIRKQQMDRRLKDSANEFGTSFIDEQKLKFKEAQRAKAQELLRTNKATKWILEDHQKKLDEIFQADLNNFKGKTKE